MFKVSPYYTLYGSTLERPCEFDDRGLRTLGRDYLNPENKGMFLEHTEKMDPVLHQIRNLKLNQNYQPSKMFNRGKKKNTTIITFKIKKMLIYWNF